MRCHYMAVLQILMNGEMYRGERLLRADTIATMFQDLIGYLQPARLQ